MSIPKIYYIMGFLGDEPMPIGPMDFDPKKLHVTYLDKFAFPDDRLDELAREVAAIGKFFWPPMVTVGSQAEMWGSEGDIPVVNVIDRNEKHELMNQTIRRSVLDLGGELINNFPYRPHVSHCSERDTDLGRITHLTLVSHDGEVGVNTRIVGNFPIGLTQEEMAFILDGGSIGEIIG